MSSGAGRCGPAGETAIRLSSRVVEPIVAAFFVAILAAYALSFLGTLLLTGGAWVVGLTAFVATWVAAHLRGGLRFAPRPVVLRGLWRVLLPVCIALAILAVALTLGFGFDARAGVPEIGREPLLAPRARYLLSGGAEISRWRFVLIGVSFQLAWHLVAFGFALETWLGEPVGGRREKVAPPAGRHLRSELKQVRARFAAARRGRLSRTHVKRIRGFVFFVMSSRPLFYCLFALVAALFVAAGAGLIPPRAAGLPVLVAFGWLWLGLALDLVLSVWEREVWTAVWMAAWVAGIGVVVVALARSLVAGWGC